MQAGAGEDGDVGVGLADEQLELKVGANHEKWTADDIATLAALGKAIKAGETTVYEEFEPQGEQAQESEPVQGELA